jgi:hypothetical protein
MAPSKTFNIAGTGVAFTIIEDAGMRKAYSFDLKRSMHVASLFGYEAACCRAGNGRARSFSRAAAGRMPWPGPTIRRRGWREGG